MTKLPLFLIAPLLTLSACKNESVAVYDAAKDPAPSAGMPMAGGMSAGTAAMPGEAAKAPLAWEAPSIWQAQAASGMRMGSYLFVASNKQKVDISVVPLGGEAGGDLSNVNRWRGQLQLAPIDEAQLSKDSQTIRSRGHSFRVVDYVSEQPMIDGKFKQRLVAAILPHGEQTIFVKMMGEDAAVRENRYAFLQFLRTFRFTSHD